MIGSTHKLAFPDATIEVTMVQRVGDQDFVFHTNKGIFQRTVANAKQGVLIFDGDGDPINVAFASEEIKEQKVERSGAFQKEIVAPMACTLKQLRV